MPITSAAASPMPRMIQPQGVLLEDDVGAVVVDGTIGTGTVVD
jgi:hypothetical protein